jgi:hypothetical protein
LLIKYGYRVQDQAVKVDPNYLCSFLDDITNALSPASVTNCYIDHLFGVDTDQTKAKLETAALREVFHDCLIFSLKYIEPELNPNSVTESARKTLRSIMDSFEDQYSIQHSDSAAQHFVTKEPFKAWVFDEFPDLFFGYHSWILARIEEKSFSKVSGRTLS